MTVAEARAALAPARRSAVVAVAPALGTVPAEDVTADATLPPHARAVVDGYAVRAADTYAAGETLPAFLEVTGSVVCSTITTASAPCGSSPPVGIVIAAPGPTSPSGARPIATAPVTSRNAGSVSLAV